MEDRYAYERAMLRFMLTLRTREGLPVVWAETLLREFAEDLGAGMHRRSGETWPLNTISSTLMPVDASLSVVEILKLAVDRRIDPTRNSHRESHNLAVHPNSSVRSVKRGNGE